MIYLIVPILMVCLVIPMISARTDSERLDDITMKLDKLTKIEQILNSIDERTDKETLYVYGTEYRTSENGTIFIQLLDGDSEPVINSLCFVKVYYPSKTIWIDTDVMTFLNDSDGLYYYDLVTPNYTGIYMVSVVCDVPSSAFVDTFDGYTKILEFVNLTESGGSIRLNNSNNQTCSGTPTSCSSIPIATCSSQAGCSTHSPTNYSMASPSFFLTTESIFGAGDRGVDGSNFDESPVSMNDYNDNSEKCELWDCNAWTEGATNTQSFRCTGGLNCTRFLNNGGTCAEYRCISWTASGVNRQLSYCFSGWSCTQNNSLGICTLWNCNTWTNAPTDNEAYCSGVVDCLTWNDGQCQNWNCTSWSFDTGKDDHFCVGNWSCVETNSSNKQCDKWNCSQWSDGLVANKDYYYTNGWSCTSFVGGICVKWEGQGLTAGAVAETDYSCDRWNCSTWNTTSELCSHWSCLEWRQTSATDKDSYCSGSWNCTTVKRFERCDGTATNCSSMNNETSCSGTINNTGVLNFTEYDACSNLYQAEDVWASDFDGDGFKDIVAVSYNGTIMVSKNDNCVCVLKYTNSITGTNYLDVQGVDFDYDGDYDFVTADEGLERVTWWENTGNYSFTPHIIATLTGADTYSVRAGDIDGDDDNDVIVGGIASNILYRFINTGNDLTFTQTNIATGVDAISIDLVDIDVDDDLDIIVADYFGNLVRLYKNNGVGTFTYSLVNAVTTPRDVHFADFNLDGYIDIVSVGDTVGSLYVHYNNGTAFALALINNSLSNPKAVHSGSVNNDSYPDIVVGSKTDNKTYYLLGNGSVGATGFRSYLLSANTKATYGIVIDDLDNDGDNEIITANEWGNNVIVSKNELYQRIGGQLGCSWTPQKFYTNGYIKSIAISIESYDSWYEFTKIFTFNQGNVTFSILDGSDNVLCANVNSQIDYVKNCTNGTSPIYLYANFSRSDPFFISPSLSSWYITYSNATYIDHIRGSGELHVNNWFDNIASDVWNYNGTVNPNLLNQFATFVWNYTGIINVNILNQFTDSLWNFTGTISSNVLNQFATAVWNNSNRTLTDENVSGVDVVGNIRNMGHTYIGATEYLEGDNGKIAIRLVRGTGSLAEVETGADCNITIRYPDSSIFVDNQVMTELEKGVYYYDFVVPSVIGVYPYYSSCNVTDRYYFGLDSFHVYELNKTFEGVWNYPLSSGGRNLTYYEIMNISNVTVNINESKVADAVWNYNGTISPNIISQLFSDIECNLNKWFNIEEGWGVNIPEC